MSNVKIELNSSGIRQLLNSSEIQKAVVNKAAEVAKRAGSGYEAADPHHTGQRVAVNVYPATESAVQDNYDNNTLEKSLY